MHVLVAAMASGSDGKQEDRETFGWRASSTMPAKKRRLIEGEGA